MLIELTIENFAIIDRLQVRFAPGLNVITGETGTGKSILVGALDFLLGGKVFRDMIRSGEEQTTVEASFDLTGEIIEKLFDGITPEKDKFLLVRRKLFRSGKSAAYINNRSLPLRQLREIGKLLVDILGQHEHQSLLDPESHLPYLDALGNLTEKVVEFSEKYRTLEEKEKILNKLRIEKAQKEERRRLLEFQIGEIDKASLETGEEEDLKRESKSLANAEKILQTCRMIGYQLQESENSLLATLGGFGKSARELSQLDRRLQPIEEGLESARIQLEETAFNLERYLQNVDFNPQRQEMVEERLDELYRLEKKYRRSIEELLSFKEEMEQELKRMKHSGEEEFELTEEVEKLSGELCLEAKILSDERKSAADNFQRQIIEELALLGIPECRFPVRFDNIQATGEGLEIDGLKIGKTGLDQVEFLFSANPGEEPKNLSRIVSGGELSRIMLGLKNLLGQKDAVKTLIFDEVDVGIGGKTAFMVGKKLKNTAIGHQVICITHLPQIARFAHRHLVVDKVRQADRIISRISILTESQREKEFTRMMGVMDLPTLLEKKTV